MTRRGIPPAVVAGIDGSEKALRAVRWAAAEAARRDAPLRLVSAFDWAPAEVVGTPELHDTYCRILLERTETDLGTAAAIAQREFPGIEVDQQMLVGPPSTVLLRESQRAQLLVVADRGLTRLEGLVLGSVAVAVATHSVCPAVVVRGVERDPADEAVAPVVVGVDVSMPGDSALAFAFEAAAARGVPLVAVYTWWDLLAHPVLAPILDWGAIEADERQLLADRIGQWEQKYPGVAVELVVARSRPVPVLLRQARRGQLVVVGSRGRGELGGLVLGSVGNALIHQAACPVAVVPAVSDGREETA
jgi:nucleotide-binding universal stress UspA family protein